MWLGFRPFMNYIYSTRYKLRVVSKNIVLFCNRKYLHFKHFCDQYLEIYRGGYKGRGRWRGERSRCALPFFSSKYSFFSEQLTLFATTTTTTTSKWCVSPFILTIDLLFSLTFQSLKSPMELMACIFFTFQSNLD